MQLINRQGKIQRLLVLSFFLNSCLGVADCPVVNGVWNLLLHSILNIGHGVRLTSTQHGQHLYDEVLDVGQGVVFDHQRWMHVLLNLSTQHNKR